MTASDRGRGPAVWAPVLAVAVAVAVAAVSVTVVSVLEPRTSGLAEVHGAGPVVISSPTRQELASWTAAPASSATSVDARRHCAAGSDDDTPRAPVPDPAVLSETRGDITALVMPTWSGARFCLVSRNGLLVFRDLNDASASAHGTAERPAGGGLVNSVNDVSLGFLVGRIPPSTRGVSAEVPDLPAVTASVGSGWFIVWWPTSTPADRVRLHRDDPTRLHLREGPQPSAFAAQMLNSTMERLLGTR